MAAANAYRLETANGALATSTGPIQWLYVCCQSPCSSRFFFKASSLSLFLRAIAACCSSSARRFSSSSSSSAVLATRTGAGAGAGAGASVGGGGLEMALWYELDRTSVGSGSGSRTTGGATAAFDDGRRACAIGCDNRSRTRLLQARGLEWAERAGE
jgi:hypothetical protein